MQVFGESAVPIHTIENIGSFTQFKGPKNAVGSTNKDTYFFLCGENVSFLVANNKKVIHRPMKLLKAITPDK